MNDHISISARLRLFTSISLRIHLFIKLTYDLPRSPLQVSEKDLKDQTRWLRIGHHHPPIIFTENCPFSLGPYSPPFLTSNLLNILAFPRLSNALLKIPTLVILRAQTPSLVQNDLEQIPFGTTAPLQPCCRNPRHAPKIYLSPSYIGLGLIIAWSAILTAADPVIHSVCGIANPNPLLKGLPLINSLQRYKPFNSAVDSLLLHSFPSALQKKISRLSKSSPN